MSNQLLSQDLKASHDLISLFERSKVQVERFLDNQTGIFAILDKEGKILRSNLELAQYLNIESSQVLNSELSGLFSPLEWQDFREKIKLAALGESFSFNLPIVPRQMGEGSKLRQSDLQKDFFWKLTPYRIVDREDLRFVSVIGQDFTDLRKKERELSALFSTIPVGIMTVNTEGRIDPAYSVFCEKLLGQSNLKEQDFFQVMKKVTGESLTGEDREAMETLQSHWPIAESKYQAISDTLPTLWDSMIPDLGLKYFEIFYSPEFADGVCQKLLVIMMDRTEVMRLKQVESELKELESQGLTRILQVSKCRPEFAVIYVEEFKKMLIGLAEATKVGSREGTLKSLHSIKGNSRIAGFSKLADITHDHESKIKVLEEHQVTSNVLTPVYENINQEWSEIDSLLQGMVLKNGDLESTRHADLAKRLKEMIARLQKNFAITEPSLEKQFERTRLQWVIERLNLSSIQEVSSLVNQQFVKLSEELGVKSDLEIDFEDIYLDESKKSLLQDCFLHLINNCFAHGIESEKERQAAKKKLQGSIQLKAYLKRGEITCVVKDDGRGFNVTRIREKALQLRLHSYDELMNMSENDVIALIFNLDLSTVDKATELAGRGVGLPKVMENINKLQGSMSAGKNHPFGAEFKFSFPIYGGEVKRQFLTTHDFIDALSKLCKAVLGVEVKVHVNDNSFLIIDPMVTESAVVCHLTAFGIGKITTLEIHSSLSEFRVVAVRSGVPDLNEDIFEEAELAQFNALVSLQKNNFEVLSNEKGATISISTSAIISPASIPKFKLTGNAKIDPAMREPLLKKVHQVVSDLGVTIELEYDNLDELEVFSLFDTVRGKKESLRIDDDLDTIKRKLLSHMASELGIIN